MSFDERKPSPPSFDSIGFKTRNEKQQRSSKELITKRSPRKVEVADRTSHRPRHGDAGAPSETLNQQNEIIRSTFQPYDMPGALQTQFLRYKTDLQQTNHKVGASKKENLYFSFLTLRNLMICMLDLSFVSQKLGPE